MQAFNEHPLTVLSRIQAQEHVKAEMTPIVMIPPVEELTDGQIEEFKREWEEVSKQSGTIILRQEWNHTN